MLKDSAVLSLAGKAKSETVEVSDASIEPFAQVVFEQLFRPTRKRRMLVEEAFDALLQRLSRDGVTTFRLGALTARTKTLVRERWSAMARTELGGQGTEVDEEGRSKRVRIEPRLPGNAIALGLLARCVSRLADGLGLDQRSLKQLHSVWSHFVAHGVEVGDGRSPSSRAIARDTGVPRERVPALKRNLGGLVRRCQSSRNSERER